MIASAEKQKATVRALATEILLKVDTRKAYADVLIDQTLRAQSWDERDRALLTELVYGSLRWRGKIDARLSEYLRRPLSENNPLIRNLLRLTCYQLLFLDKIPDYAAVNEAVELAKRYGGEKTAGFVNGVLRNFLRDRRRVAPAVNNEAIESLAADYSHPEWLVKRWREDFGVEAAKALMRANNEKSPLVLRANALKCTRDELLRRFAEASISATPTPYAPQGICVQSAGSVANLPGFAEGLFQVQGESSQLVALLLAPLPGERILDACAAPGGKSTYLAELMKEQGEVIAIDPSARGCEKMRENIARLGLTSVRIVNADASRELTGALGKPYDRILIDAPCSGLGTLRSHPEIKWHRNAGDIQRLSRLQAKILHRAVAYLKPRGVLVYATCTLTPEENALNVKSLLERHQEFELQDAARYLPGEAKHMVRGNYFEALPQRDNTDGFFAARMRKVS